MTSPLPLPGAVSRRRDEPTLTISTEGQPAPSRDRLTLTLVDGPVDGGLFRHTGPALILGRSEAADVRIASAAVSRHHARVGRVDDLFYIEDLGSRNGTWVGARRLAPRTPHELVGGERVVLGGVASFRVDVHDEREQEALYAMYEGSVRDRLTGLYRRRVFEERLEAECAAATRHGSPLSLVLLDLDWFKSVNDVHGHAAGDAVLEQVGALIRRSVRREDVPARIGGEELAILARGADAAQAACLAERLRAGVEALPIPTARGELRVTVSVGVATVGVGPHAPRTPAALYAAADEALYAAKAAGRNRVLAA